MGGGADCARSSDVVAARFPRGNLRLRVRPRVVSTVETHEEESRVAIVSWPCGGVSSSTSAGSAAPISATCAAVSGLTFALDTRKGEPDSVKS